MIKYNLKCKNNHEFESWFADSIEFEKLNNMKLLECIFAIQEKSLNQLWHQWFQSRMIKMNYQ